jgi:hypothetical protein
MALDVLLSVIADGWNLWGDRFVKSQPQSRLQHTIGPSPSVVQAKAAVLRAIAAAGAGGRLIVNVGHGGGGALNLQADQGFFELAPGGVMRIVGRGVAGGFVDVFYDVNLSGPPAMSDMENDLKNDPHSPRLARWAIYQEISNAFKAAQLREVVLLTCRAGSAELFVQKVANDWGVVIRAYRQKVGILEDITTVGRSVTKRYFVYLQNNPPAGKSAAQLVLMEEQIPFSPPDTYLVGPPLHL